MSASIPSRIAYTKNSVPQNLSTTSTTESRPQRSRRNRDPAPEPRPRRSCQSSGGALANGQVQSYNGGRPPEGLIERTPHGSQHRYQDFPYYSQPTFNTGRLLSTIPNLIFGYAESGYFVMYNSDGFAFKIAQQGLALESLVPPNAGPSYRYSVD